MCSETIDAEITKWVVCLDISVYLEGMFIRRLIEKQQPEHKKLGYMMKRNTNVLIFLQILKHKDEIQDISTTASNEATLEVMLQKVRYQARSRRSVCGGAKPSA